MKIKRFQAADVRQAIQEVREVLGPDAVILSNTRVDGGVEIVAATDYDEKEFNQIACIDWFEKNCSIEGSFKTTMEIINTVRDKVNS